MTYLCLYRIYTSAARFVPVQLGLEECEVVLCPVELVAQAGRLNLKLEVGAFDG